MTHAYDKMYLNTAQSTLAHLLDNGVNRCGLDMETYYELFLLSSIREGLSAANQKL